MRCVRKWASHHPQTRLKLSPDNAKGGCMRVWGCARRGDVDVWSETEPHASRNGGNNNTGENIKERANSTSLALLCPITDLPPCVCVCVDESIHQFLMDAHPFDTDILGQGQSLVSPRFLLVTMATDATVARLFKTIEKREHPGK
ncbi:unnamed protein product [Mesocestoides corti]|uniref:Uncharacterized protein n=1 Tax=Mesocestoides corti TaxID=53468 RepID=A0A0R3U8B7_MESCO|nr:unnamed protein product [Mesocestoides corti]